MIRKHQCLDGNTERLGDSWDCPKCRVALLDSFRTSPGIPETGLRTTPNLFHPHLIVPPEHTRTVPLDVDEAEHTVIHGTQPFTDGRAGGIWRAVCRCGWRREGRYAGPRYRAQAEEVARQHADAHVDEAELTPPQPLPETEHITNAVVIPNTGRQGGIWKAACTCGWHEHGSYGRDTGEGPARRLADLKTKAHLNDVREGPTT